MKTFVNKGAQGELWISRIEKLPGGLIKVEPDDGLNIVGHSETGHHHVMDADKVEMYRLPEDVYECFLVVKEPAVLRHLRAWDTHEDLLHAPGIYRVRRQREHTPDGWRRSAD